MSNLLTLGVPTHMPRLIWAHPTHANAAMGCHWMGLGEPTAKITPACDHTCPIHNISVMLPSATAI